MYPKTNPKDNPEEPYVTLRFKWTQRGTCINSSSKKSWKASKTTKKGGDTKK